MSHRPFVSVIMPVRNEAAYIERSLGAVLAQDYSGDRMEILIADGMSTDGTREIIAELNRAHPEIPLTLLDNVGRIAPTGLNAGIAKAKGDIIVRVDGHCEIEPDYVSKCVYHLLQGRADAVGGPIETVGETAQAQIIALAMSSPFGVGGYTFRTVTHRAMFVDTVAFPGYTRRAIEMAGAFDEELVRNQDDEFNYRLRKLGGRILLTPEIKSRYYSRSSLGSLWRQYFQYGYWKVRVMQKHPRQMRLRQFVPPLLVFALLSAAAIAMFTNAGRVLLGTIVGLYLLANLIASVKTASLEKWRMIPLLSLCFAILHVSYGAGFLMGLICFWKGWGNHIINSHSASYEMQSPPHA